MLSITKSESNIQEFNSRFSYYYIEIELWSPSSSYRSSLAAAN